MSDPTFTAQDALATTTALREALGLKPEQFPPKAFVGMISDEIEQLRAKGQDDSSIAALVAEATGKSVSAEMITQFYAPPDERGHRGED